MISKAAFGAVLLLCSALSVYSFSLSQTNYATYVKPRCFNQSTTLGQIRPNGLTVENLISMIQRAELQYPNLKPQEILIMFLQRFHMEGMDHDRQSPIGFRHSNLLQVILDDNTQRQPNFDAVEKIFTEDEKCNLFFTLSHSVNQTAEDGEHEDNTYMAPALSRAPIVAEKPKQNMGNEVPVQTKKVDPKDLPPVASTYLNDDNDKPNVKNASNKRAKREEKRRILTKKPREFGVSSFLAAPTKPIAMGRVLLGLYAGYAAKPKQSIREILKTLGQNLHEGVEDRQIDPLMAVTLADLYGMIPEPGQIAPTKWEYFGAEGSWNNSECHTKFTLNSNKGLWVTGADLRGALDGFNIGKAIEYFRDMPVSQALRNYYSKQGFIEAGICKRDDKSRSEIESDLKADGESYLHMWNAYYYGNQFELLEIQEYIKNAETPFREELRKAKESNAEEQALCNAASDGQIGSAEVETNADVYFMLDAKNACDEPEAQRDARTAEQCNKTAQIISSITRQLRLNRHHGTVSVFYNVKSLDGNNLVGDSGDAISTKLHSRLYNSTSNQCASCRALDAPEKSLDTIEKRLELFTLINEQIKQIKSADRADKQGLPAKIFFWFDVGTIDNLAVDKNNQLELKNILRELKTTNRDVNYFGVGTNETKLSDLVTQAGNLINLNADSTKLEPFVAAVMKAPQIFEYPYATNVTSKNVTVQNYITPGYRQFWMMSPTQFIRSKDLKMSFKAKDYAIEVCVGREPEPDKNPSQCKSADNAGQSVSWTFNTPCQVNFEKCAPYYFTVAVKTNTKASMSADDRCQAKECQNILQTPWYFSHTNLRGSNGSSALGASILMISIAFILQKFFSF